MRLVAEVAAPPADDTLDVIREAESILVQALFDDLVRTIRTTRGSTLTAAQAFELEARVFREPGRMPHGGGEYEVFRWARSPPVGSAG